MYVLIALRRRFTRPTRKTNTEAPTTHASNPKRRRLDASSKKQPMRRKTTKVDRRRTLRNVPVVRVPSPQPSLSPNLTATTSMLDDIFSDFDDVWEPLPPSIDSRPSSLILDTSSMNMSPSTSVSFFSASSTPSPVRLISKDVWLEANSATPKPASVYMDTNSFELNAATPKPRRRRASTRIPYTIDMVDVTVSPKPRRVYGELIDRLEFLVSDSDD
jgi:hypothetical protein